MLGLDTRKTKTIGYILVFNDRILPETDFHIFVPGGGWINIWGGGCCCLLWPGRGDNARKGQGKCLTKFVF